MWTREHVYIDNVKAEPTMKEQRDIALNLLSFANPNAVG